MPTTDQTLERETLKWLGRLEKLKIPSPGDRKTREALDNMGAYMKDCRHFLQEKDFMRAFEAVIYAWGIYETLKMLDLLYPSK